MKVTVERGQLLKSLGHVYRVVEKRNTIPVLSNVLLRAEGSSLHLKATDLDIEVVERLAAEVGQPGATTVPAHMLYDIIRKLPDGSQIMLEQTDEGQIAVRSGRSRFQLQTIAASDFPDIATGEFPHSFTLAAKDLKRLIDKTQFAISTEETRYYLNGIFLHTMGAKLCAVATDGHRLAKVELDMPDGSEDMAGVIVPRKTVAEVQRMAEDPEAQVQIDLSGSKVRFTFGELVMTSKLIDGTFPDYERVIPKGNDKLLTVDKGDFTAAVDRVSTISSERGRAVKMAAADGQLTLSVTNPDSGSATEEVGAGFDAGPIEVGFNSRYLLDIMGQIDGDTAEFKLADAGAPTLIQDPTAPNALYVLMPMRV